MAKENSTWGYVRIRDELMKVGLSVAATTVRSVLLAAGIPPASRRSELSWKQFLAAHAETLVATGFFSVDTIFWKRLYVVVFLHLGSRRILAAECTDHPDAAWVTQQARNLIWQLEDDGIMLSHVIHDHDGKYPPTFDVVFEAQGARVIRTPLLAPRANSYVERWIGSCRRESLDRMLIVRERHLRSVLRHYVEHYNRERPHQGRDHRPPVSPADPAPSEGRIQRVTRLGGLLSDYRRLPVAA